MQAILSVCSASHSPPPQCELQEGMGGGRYVFLSPVESRAPSRVPGTWPVLYMNSWVEAQESPLVNTHSEVHSYEAPTNCMDTHMLPVHMAGHMYKLKHTHTDTPTHTQEGPIQDIETTHSRARTHTGVNTSDKSSDKQACGVCVCVSRGTNGSNKWLTETFLCLGCGEQGSIRYFLDGFRFYSLVLHTEPV